MCAALGAVILASCGGGGGGSESGGTTSGGSTPSTEAAVSVPAAMLPTSNSEATRFLIQASFGPTTQDVARVRAVGYSNWIDEQFNMGMRTSHLQVVEAAATRFKQPYPLHSNVTYSWWTHAVLDPAQLRQRVAFALSEIFVISSVSDNFYNNGRMVASYLDMLTEKSGGNYRDLLEAVALHPAMGEYLSHRGNRKEDAQSGRVPDENFAREVMQLFSIGLYELDDSAQPKLVNGAPVETYTPDDVKGMAKVFTGWNWYVPAAKATLDWWRCFWRTQECYDLSQDVTSMTGYGSEHSITEKRFLGVTVGAQSSSDAKASVKAALDRLANHPNTAPFISKQLIQRLVTSNPSPAYVADITRVFRSTNGNLRAVVKAILLHDEARNAETAKQPTFGKLREPVLRLAHLMRAFPLSSDTYQATAAAGTLPFYLAFETDSPSMALGQSPLRSPSVFNFFRPGYKAPQTDLADNNLVAPEMQITTETSVLGYANFIAYALQTGWGQWNTDTSRPDIHFDLSQWQSLAGQPQQLIDAVSNRLMGQNAPADVAAQAVYAIGKLPNANAQDQRTRVQAAVLLIAVSPGFLIQQ